MVGKKWVACVVWLMAAAAATSCGRKGPRYDENLLKNGSFENVGSDGIPEGWKLEPFRGAENEAEVQYGIDTSAPHDGKKAWFFRGDPGTRRWRMLSQEVEVPDGVPNIQVQGWIQTDETRMLGDQFMHANFLLTFYNSQHERFRADRFADQRTPFRHGTRPWTEERETFHLPGGTRFVKISCVLGANGQIWFDNVALTIPKPIPWETATSKNFVFHWMPGHPMPNGSQQSQQQIFDYISSRLHVDSKVVINYFFYPDTTTIRQTFNITGWQQVNWDDVEIHSVNANDNHEVVHLITDKIGRPPQVIAEGTVYWVLDDWNGKTIDECMAGLMAAARIPKLENLFDPAMFAMSDDNMIMPVAASFVGYLVQRWGPDKLMDLYAAANGVNTWSGALPAFESVYGMPLPNIEAAWHTVLTTKYGRYGSGK